ncbi:MAG TPA: acyl carrier protein [Thermoanaerobaculia bacterium]|nr:acyl carrier protein [Thermoanaerobaculia bacterium]
MADPKYVAEVRNRFSEVMQLDPDTLDFDARLDDAYGVTSVNRMRLVSELEIALEIEIPEPEINAICTLGDVVALCERYSIPTLQAASGRA